MITGVGSLSVQVTEPRPFTFHWRRDAVRSISDKSTEGQESEVSCPAETGQPPKLTWMCPGIAQSGLQLKVGLLSRFPECWD